MENSGRASSWLARPSVWAGISALLVLGWQSATVRANYAGDYSGLFRTGTRTVIPPDLISTTRRDSSPLGYDGQYYRFVAHDPLLRHGTANYLDGPSTRARRILVPALAWMLALGQQRRIDGAYVLVIAGFISLGVYWLGCLMSREDRAAANGLLFLIIPATIVSIDRMTVDVALTALTAGLVLEMTGDRERWVWPILCATVLVRETGLLLVAACVLIALHRRELVKAAAWFSAAIPALCWYGYLQLAPLQQAAYNTEMVPDWAIPRLQLGILTRILHPPRYPLPHRMEMIARGLDSVALVAMVATAVMAIWLLRHLTNNWLKLAILLNAALLLAMTRPGFWITPFGYARPFGPLFILLLAVAAVQRGQRALATAVVLALIIDVRLSTEIRAQALGVIRWLKMA